jgi:hypothetical protein
LSHRANLGEDDNMNIVIAAILAGAFIIAIKKKRRLNGKLERLFYPFLFNAFF